jgi:transposase InsO family protein
LELNLFSLKVFLKVVECDGISSAAKALFISQPAVSMQIQNLENYLAVVIDLYSRKVVGWAMSIRMNAVLATEVFMMAHWRRKRARGLIHHSDRGSQYAGSDYRKLLGA